jgi:hypothetical protein
MSVTGNVMSEELKRRLYNYEENPSGRIWDKIAASLDEEINAKFPQRLYEAEVTPPADAWNKIATAVEKEEYPTKLYNLEVAPPSGAWQKISDALDDDETLPQIPSKRRVVPFMRYAVAASVIGILAFGALKLINQKTGSSVAVKTTMPQRATPTTIQPNTNSQKDSSVQTATALSNNLPKPGVALVKASVASRKRSVQQGAYMTLLANASAGENPSAGAFQHASLRGEVPGNCPVISDADRYLSFMNPDGYLIRMSKKLADALGCYYTNGNSEEYRQCQEQIKKWRDKIAQSPASSSPNNFMDLLDIIRTVQDKEF